MIKRLKIGLLSSRVKNNILLNAALVRKILFSPLEDKSHMFVYMHACSSSFSHSTT